MRSRWRQRHRRTRPEPSTLSTFTWQAPLHSLNSSTISPRSRSSMARSARRSTWRGNASHLSKGCRRCLPLCFRSLSTVRAANGSRNCYLVLPNMLMTSLSFVPCRPISSIILRRSCWFIPGNPAWATQRLVLGLPMGLEVKTKICLDMWCCSVVEKLLTRGRVFGEAAFCRRCIKVFSVARQETPCSTCRIPKGSIAGCEERFSMRSRI